MHAYSMHHGGCILTTPLGKYLLLVQGQVGEAPPAEGVYVVRPLLEDGAEVVDGRLALAQQGVTAGPLQQRVDRPPACIHQCVNIHEAHSEGPAEPRGQSINLGSIEAHVY